MKELFKKILILKLDFLAKLYLWRFKPEIIAITGNVGKTSTKGAIEAVLSQIKKVRAGRGNLNNEIGVPLTIIGEWGDSYYESGNNPFYWFRVLFVSFFNFLFTTDYPDVLVLEYGADRPGDIARLVKKYKPHIGVVTAVGDVPVHVEYFSDPDKVAKEKSKLISGLLASDYAVLNYNDPAVYEMREKTKAKVWSFGYAPEKEANAEEDNKAGHDLNGPTITLSNFHLRSDNEKPIGIGFKIHYGGNSFVPVTIDGTLGKAQTWAAGAAVSVGLIYGMNLIEISQALASSKGPKGRLKIISGIKNSLIIDDTYNAAPASMHLALETLRDLPAKRRIAVLGDMLELGQYTVEAHRAIGQMAGEVADILVTVGLRANIIADSAAGVIAVNEGESVKDKIFSFPTSDLAKAKVQEIVTGYRGDKDGVDLILIKGSQGIRMEKIVEEIMAEPLKKKDLLVRQSPIWQNR